MITVLAVLWIWYIARWVMRQGVTVLIGVAGVNGMMDSDGIAGGDGMAG